MEWLKAIAPTVASALGGPLAGVAVSILADKLGVKDATQDKIKEVLTNGNLSGEQIAAIKVAELDLKGREQELGFKFAELEIRDRDSARQMQVATKSPVPGFLAVGITAGFFTILLGMGLGSFNATDNQAMLIMLGSLGTAFAQVLNYYFGSTKGSADKTDMIARAQALK